MNEAIGYRIPRLKSKRLGIEIVEVMLDSRLMSREQTGSTGVEE